MKVLVLNGSPKKKSDTMQLTESFLKGFSEGAEAEIEIMNVIEKEINPCIGCFGCWIKKEGRCVLDDDQNELLDKYVEADVVIWSFPLYCFGMPSHLKAVLDRMIPFVKMDMAQCGDEVRHVSLVNLENKKTVVICGAGFPYSENNFEGVRITCNKCFHNPTMVFVPETPLMNLPAAKPLTDVKREQFVQAGKEYALQGCLKNLTVQMLESLMMPNEEYIRNVNGN